MWVTFSSLSYQEDVNNTVLFTSYIFPFFFFFLSYPAFPKCKCLFTFPYLFLCYLWSNLLSCLDAWHLEGENRPNSSKPCCASNVSREDPGMSQWFQPERATFQHCYAILQKKQIILIIYKRYTMLLVFKVPNTGMSSAYLVQGKRFCFMIDPGAVWGRNYKTGHIRHHLQLT